jgi:hypothetical protein
MSDDERPPIVVQFLIPASDMEIIMRMMHTGGIGTLDGVFQLAMWNQAKHFDIDELTNDHFALSRRYPTWRNDQ